MGQQGFAAAWLFTVLGWAVREIDGNDLAQITGCLDAIPFEKGRPSLVVARTVKGKGLSFAQNKVGYHYWKPSAEELAAAERELDLAPGRE